MLRPFSAVQPLIWHVSTCLGVQLPQFEGDFSDFFLPREWKYWSYCYGGWSWKELSKTTEHSCCLSSANTCRCACSYSSKFKVCYVFCFGSYVFLWITFLLWKISWTFIKLISYCFEFQGIKKAFPCTRIRNYWCICCCYCFELLKAWVTWFEWVSFTWWYLIWFLHIVVMANTGALDLT